MNTLRRNALWIMALLVGQGGEAHANACYGKGLLERGDVVQIVLDEDIAGGEIELRTSRSLDLRTPRLAVENATDTRFSSSRLLELEVPLRLEGEMLAKRHIARGLQLTQVRSADGVIVKSGDEYFSLGEYTGKLPIEPQTYESLTLTIRADTRLELSNAGKPRLPKDSDVYWEVDRRLPSFAVARTAYYSKASPLESATRLEIEDQARVPPGGTIKVTIVDPDFSADEESRLRFCVTVAGEHHVLGPQDYSIDSRNAGESSVLLSMPDGVEMGWKLFTGAELVLASVDGKVNGATIPMRLTNPYLAGLLSLAVLLAFLVLWRIRNGNWGMLMEATRGRSGRLSLSNFQILVWTIIVVFAYVFVWITTGFVIDLAEGILGLLGISTVTAATAKGVAAGRESGAGPSDDAGTPEPVTAQSGAPAPSSLGDLVSSEGRLDVLRFQMLGFNTFAWVYTIVGVLYTQSLPVIPESLFWLLGISNTGYIGGKIVKPSGAVAGGPLDEFETSLSSDALKALQEKLGSTPSGVLDAETRREIRAFQVTNGLPVVDGVLSQELYDRITEAPV